MREDWFIVAAFVLVVLAVWAFVGAVFALAWLLEAIL